METDVDPLACLINEFKAQLDGILLELSKESMATGDE
jgi:hypothetical protein